jgi:hypothetical protein
MSESPRTLYLKKRQAPIDGGWAVGVKSFQADHLPQAHKTIAELDEVKATMALLNEEEPDSPKAVPGCREP